MKIYTEIETGEELARYLQENAWSGARDRITSLDYDDLVSKCEELLSYMDECTDTELNDEVWFGDLFNEEEDDDNEEDEEDEEEDDDNEEE